MCCILNSENNSLPKLLTNSFPLSECSWSSNRYTLKCGSINTLAIVCPSLLGIRYARQYRLKLSYAMSMYLFPLIVSNIETRSTYSFSPTYPVKEGMCSPWSSTYSALSDLWPTLSVHPSSSPVLVVTPRDLLKVPWLLALTTHQFNSVNSPSDLDSMVSL